ncbi:MAG TPA: hypothetical protein VHW01_07850, partial [Polyangiaceae bacterium]|nr:hypothetical protein [Polyangiaceae bacterium]
MSRVLLCSVVLLSAACGSSGSDAGGAAGASAHGGAGGAVSGGGSSGTPGTAGAPVSGGGATGSAGNAGTPGAGGAVGAAGTNAGAGAGGAGTAGAGGASGGSGGATVGNESVTQRGGDNAKTSHWIAASLTKANVMTKMALDANFKANFNGELTSSPLFLAGATPGSGRFFAATTENDVYAFDEMTGAVVMGWP